MNTPVVKKIPNAQEPAPGYWAALGEFIHHFSKVERTLQILMRQQAGVNWMTAKAIFSGVKADQCKDNINRICDARGWPELRDRLSGPFAQLGHIIGVRNAIVHWGTFVTEDDQVISMNDLLAHTPDRIRNIPAGADTLKQMIADLIKINFHLCDELTIPRGGKDEFNRIAPPYLGASWQYKPPPQSPRPKSTPQLLPEL